MRLRIAMWLHDAELKSQGRVAGRIAHNIKFALFPRAKTWGGILFRQAGGEE